MAPTLQSLGIDQLSVADRLTLVHDIWDSIAHESPVPSISDELRAELDRRIDEDDANPEDVVDWEIVKAEALARSKKQ